jgi:hypothetical protein
MIDSGANKVLLFAGNGANRPLHQDRQVLRAGDLTLEQATQDAMLARARRYLHGWGVVSGFLLEVNDTVLTIGPGYGVTPLGDELFLPEAVTLPDAASRAVLCCGPGPLGCAIVDAEALEAALAAAVDVTVSAFLIAQPASREASPRPGVPKGCEHPGSALLPSRRCGGVEFAILCQLPPSHQTKSKDCGDLSPFVCGIGEQPPQPLPWEGPLGAEANFLVIAELFVSSEAFTARAGARRTLWPVSLMQDWIAACLCPIITREKPIRDEKEDVRPSDPVLSPEPGRPVVVDDGFAVLTLPGRQPGESAIVPQEVAIGIRDRLSDSVTGLGAIGPARAHALKEIGVTTEGDFLTAKPEVLAAALKLPEAKVAEMKRELSDKRNLGLIF